MGEGSAIIDEAAPSVQAMAERIESAWGLLKQGKRP
jgi:hypothetical protein